MLPVLGPGEFIVICNRGRSSFLAVRLSAAPLRGRIYHPFPYILFPLSIAYVCGSGILAAGWARVKNREGISDVHGAVVNARFIWEEEESIPI